MKERFTGENCTSKPNVGIIEICWPRVSRLGEGKREKEAWLPSLESKIRTGAAPQKERISASGTVVGESGAKNLMVTRTEIECTTTVMCRVAVEESTAREKGDRCRSPDGASFGVRPIQCEVAVAHSDQIAIIPVLLDRGTRGDDADPSALVGVVMQEGGSDDFERATCCKDCASLRRGIPSKGRVYNLHGAVGRDRATCTATIALKDAVIDLHILQVV